MAPRLDPPKRGIATQGSTKQGPTSVGTRSGSRWNREIAGALAVLLLSSCAGSSGEERMAELRDQSADVQARTAADEASTATTARRSTLFGEVPRSGLHLRRRHHDDRDHLDGLAGGRPVGRSAPAGTTCRDRHVTVGRRSRPPHHVVVLVCDRRHRRAGSARTRRNPGADDPVRVGSMSHGWVVTSAGAGTLISADTARPRRR